MLFCPRPIPNATIRPCPRPPDRITLAQAMNHSPPRRPETARAFAPDTVQVQHFPGAMGGEPGVQFRRPDPGGRRLVADDLAVADGRHRGAGAGLQRAADHGAVADRGRGVGSVRPPQADAGGAGHGADLFGAADIAHLYRRDHAVEPAGAHLPGRLRHRALRARPGNRRSARSCRAASCRPRSR